MRGCSLRDSDFFFFLNDVCVCALSVCLMVVCDDFDERERGEIFSHRKKKSSMREC